MPRHQRDVLAPVAQRRDPNRHHAQPIEQIFAKPPGADLGAELAVGGGDDPHIHLDAARPPYPLEGLLLQDPHDLALGLERHVGDLVEEQGAAMGALERAHLARCTVDAGFGPEQLDFEPLRAHCCAVDRNEGTLRSPGTCMQKAPDDLLAGAGRPGNQNPAAGRRHPLDLLPQLVGRRRGADQVEITSGPQPQLLVLAPQLRRLDGALDDQQQPVGFERLFDKIIGAELDRLDRRLDRSVPADHDDRHRRHLGAQLLQDFDAFEPAPLQPYVENDEGRLARLDRGQGLRAYRQPHGWRSPRP